jgi:diacylglycerol kinase family enzyme
LRDGLLDVCLIDSLPVGRALRVSLGMALGNLPNSSAAEYFRVTQARVEAASPLGYHVDGDYLGHSTSFEVDIMPMALEVAV